MLRLLPVLCALAVPAAGPAAPRAKDPGPPAYYFATAVGAEWVYSHRLGDEASEWTERVTAVDRRPDRLVVTVRRHEEGKPDPEPVRFGVSDRGLYFPADEEPDGKGGPPSLVELPGKPGATWTDGGVTITTVGEEEVEVPAGRYRAVRVEMAVGAERAGAYTHFTWWYAPGVGVVRDAVRIHPLGKGQGGVVESHTVLKSFKHGPAR